jgi:hypothetical protein
MMTLEQDRKHVEVMMDADEEIKSARQGATATLDGLKKVSGVRRISALDGKLMTVGDRRSGGNRPGRRDPVVIRDPADVRRE